MTRSAILWDMDGTLVDSEPLHQAALVTALEAQGLAAPEGFHDIVVGSDARSVHRWCQTHLGLTLGLQDWLRLKYRTYFASLDGLAHRAGAIELFRELAGTGITQAIVSNSDRMVVSANLDAAGLTEPGLVTVSRNDVRQGKPAAEPYLRAAWLIGKAPGTCIVVEDSVTGAQAGVAAGMRTLFWPQTDQAPPPGAERITDAGQLGAILRGAKP
ncbi:MAG TPA: HAD family phosphatase [Paracoccaceae bacterium]|nr:HAD family phosphatase [Paracoccaceae bacterium]